MGYVPPRPRPRPGAARLVAVQKRRPFRWPWQLPALNLALDDTRTLGLGKTSTRITVEPRDAYRERWGWQVEVLFDGHPSFIDYTMGGSRRRPSPYTVTGRARDEGRAWERARAVVADWNARKAAEVLRQSMVRDQVVPQ